MICGSHRYHSLSLSVPGEKLWNALFHIPVGLLTLLPLSPTPTATEDYTSIMSQTIVFQPGQTNWPFTVEIVPDEFPEPTLHSCGWSSQHPPFLLWRSLMMTVSATLQICQSTILAIQTSDARSTCCGGTWVESVGGLYLSLSHLSTAGGFFVADARGF